MPANPEFQELIIKNILRLGSTEVPEMQIYSLRQKREEFLRIILQLLQLLFHQGCLPQN
jgi:hypothetical protein